MLNGLTTTYDQINGNPNYVPAYADAGFDSASVVGFMPYGSSKYNGLQTSLKRSFSNGLQFQVAWTWSHAMDNSTADVFSTYLTPRRPQNFQCFECDWSDSALDRRHRVTVQMLYDLPFLKHSDSWAEKNLLGNWEISPGLYLPVAGIWRPYNPELMSTGMVIVRATAPSLTRLA